MQSNNSASITFNNYEDDTSLGGDSQRGNINMRNPLDKFQTYLEVKYRKKKSILQYYRGAKYFYEHIEYKPTSRITSNDVMKYVASLNKKGLRHNSIACYIQSMDMYLEYIGRAELRIPIPRSKSIHRDTITRQQIQKILRYARDNCHIMEYLILLFVTDLDCRPHEIALSRWDWVKDNKIFFKDCKTGDTTGYLTNELIETLRIWEGQQDPKSEYIFINIGSQCKGLPLSVNGWKIRNLIRKTSKKVIGRRLNPQDLRASVMTEEFNHFINPKVIQRKARHSDYKSTLKYNHVDDKNLIDYIDTGTIFNTEYKVLSKGIAENPVDKASHI